MSIPDPVAGPHPHPGASPSELEAELLRLCHVSPGRDALLKGLAEWFAAATGCEAVGIRLQRDEDFPYYETRGFADAFVRSETLLCDRDADGNLERDALGNPVLSCMCGNVICGRIDPSKPFFTAHGSFWTSSTSALLASTSEADRQSRTRNRCNGEGYESVALIPLRTSGTTFGLVQFNDRRPGRFDAALVRRLETLVDYVAIAVAKFEAEDALRRSEERYRIVADQTYDWEFWTATDGRILYMSPSCERVTGHPVGDFVADPGLRRRLIAPDHQDAWDRHERDCHRAGIAGSAVFKVVRRDGTFRWVHHVCRPVFSGDGLHAGVRASNRDVTDHHLAEEARDGALRAQQDLVEKLQEALAKVKTLHGFIPICASCKKIRNDAGYWQAVEVYVRDRTDAEFSHGLCPACAERLYPGLADDRAE